MSKINEFKGSEISYRGRNYRVQNARGWKHIIVTTNKKKELIGVSDILKDAAADLEFDYYFNFGWQEWN